MKLFKHLKIIRIHRKYVRRACFKMGIPWQGLIHDLSKYSITELGIAKYYTGKKSPHEVCREEIGYSPSWIHHYHKQKHHWQFWLDMEDWPDKVIPIKMPYKYVVEMFCDMLGASKAYNQKEWKPISLWNYWVTKCKGKRLMNEESEYLLEKLIWNHYQFCERETEKEFFKWYKMVKSYLKDEYNNGKILSDMMIPFDAVEGE